MIINDAGPAEAIRYGGDYNPEQWSKETWVEDVRLMQEAGVNLVSVGIFAWVTLEPAPGVFDFALLDEIFELMHDAGIRIDLGTPTAAPPAWLYESAPDDVVVTRDGLALGSGSRGALCPSSSAYAAACERIVTALATRYGSHPALAMWHVHNEFGAPVSECYCPTSSLAFAEWLRVRYGTLDELNTMWGNAFWGLRFTSWDQVKAPRTSASVVNPAARLDFARFTNDAVLACFTRERDILHRLSPGVPVTTNFMATSCPSMNYWAWAKEVDVVSNDHYLEAADPRNFVSLAMDADMTRSLAGGRPWILMEHSTSAVSWQPHNVAKLPGEMARNAMQHLGRGADGIMFFQWRASRFGAEKFHSAMLPHAGTDSRVWREVVALGETLGKLGPVVGSLTQSRAAIVWDWESMWAQDLEWRPSELLGHRERIRAYYEWLWREGITADFVHPQGDLSGYDLVLLPASYLLSADAGANVTEYVRAGGTAVVGCFSGIVDEMDRVHEGGYPGPLAEVLGLRVEEFTPIREGIEVGLERVGGVGAGVGAGSASATTAIWAEDVDLAGAQAVWNYTDGPVPGRAAVTRNAFGEGQAWYVSTAASIEALATILEDALTDAGLAPTDDGADVEVITRASQDRTFTVAINHSPTDTVLAISGEDLATGEVSESFALRAGGVRVIAG